MKQNNNISNINGTTISRNGNTIFCSNFIGRCSSNAGSGVGFVDETVG